LERIYQEVLQKFDGQQPPRPDNWGGFRVLPEVFEFWQGRKSRLHDRLRYKIAANDQWKIERLAP
jgi:pyridoxamine 5'-phosphate oxidase